MSQIAVTGASGKLGVLVLDELLKRVAPERIVAIAREPSKLAPFAAKGVVVRRGDYDEPETLARAFEGVSRALLISGTDMQRRLEHHTTVIDAAVAAKLELLAYTSVLRASTTALPVAPDHKATEERIRASGVPFVFLRNGWYIENYLDDLSRPLAYGAFLGAAGEGRIAGASRRDYATAAAVVLSQPGHDNRIYELAGDRAFTLTELASSVSRWAEKPVVYRNMPPSELSRVLSEAGLPPFVAQLFAGVDVAIEEGALESSSSDLHALIGRDTQTIDEVLQSLARPAH